MKDKVYKYLGAIHIHTRFSDGSDDIEKITKAAKKADLDWIIITDHNCMKVKEGIYNGVTVVVGEEISPENNHYLALDIKNEIKPSKTPVDFIEEVRKQGGFGIVAHPDEKDNRKNSYKPIRWLDKSLIPDGVEIWNWFSQWGDNYNERNILGQIYSVFFKHQLISEPYAETMNWWDELNNKTDKIIPAIGGLDVHAFKIRKFIIFLTVFSYEMSFKTITNQIILNKPLADDFEERKRQIFSAIRNGNNLIVNRKISSNIPDVTVKNNKKTAYCGESTELDENTFLNINSQQNAKIKIFRNGEEIKSLKTDKYLLKISQSGKYRVEFELKNKGFCYTNPIIVN